MDKCAVFIDAGYLKQVLKSHGSQRIDYVKLSDLMVGSGAQRLRTYYYDCPPYVSSSPTVQEKQLKAGFDKFQNKLNKLSRFELRLGKLKKRLENGRPVYEQKMVDILLAIDLVRLSVGRGIARAVLITNDTDFVPAINVAKDAGVIVELYRGGGDHNDALLDACDDCHLIDSNLISKALLPCGQDAQAT